MRRRGAVYHQWRTGGPVEVTYSEIQECGMQVNIQLRPDERGMYRVFIGCYGPDGLCICEQQCVTLFDQIETALEWAQMMSRDIIWFGDGEIFE